MYLTDIKAQNCVGGILYRKIILLPSDQLNARKVMRQLNERKRNENIFKLFFTG